MTPDKLWDRLLKLSGNLVVAIFIIIFLYLVWRVTQVNWGFLGGGQ